MRLGVYENKKLQLKVIKLCFQEFLEILEFIKDSVIVESVWDDGEVWCLVKCLMNNILFLKYKVIIVDNQILYSKRERFILEF